MKCVGAGRILRGLSLAFALSLVGLTGCSTPASESSSKAGKQTDGQPATPPSYNWESPDRVMEMPPELIEISGLSWDNGRLVGVQDEAGTLYFLSPETGQVEETLTFTENGDFEAVEKVDEVWWALREDGRLYMVGPTGKEIKFQTWLTEKDEPEGLGLDPQSGQLMVATKDYLGLFLMDKNGTELGRENQLQFTREDVLAMSGLDKFRVAGVAVHPQTGERYLLSSKRPGIALASPEGELLGVIPLQLGESHKPEGICFAPNGDLYLAAEGKKVPGRVYMFSYQPAK